MALRVAGVPVPEFHTTQPRLSFQVENLLQDVSFFVFTHLAERLHLFGHLECVSRR